MEFYTINEIVEKGLLDEVFGKATYMQVRSLVLSEKLKSIEYGTGVRRKYRKIHKDWIDDYIKANKPKLTLTFEEHRRKYGNK